ncbi:hypothetical protein PsorP6_000554 [Peronosclerospora sorghi]|uniref:Uncharacterized protein n=1 Tax=Peronosclerospora sorghi TaxID=230839 RepID=A0ACC0WX10_9STRA|nr:hypothetical protein PsorP6_000554 [Peronosclerospora sorghi]
MTLYDAHLPTVTDAANVYDPETEARIPVYPYDLLENFKAHPLHVIDVTTVCRQCASRNRTFKYCHIDKGHPSCIRMREHFHCCCASAEADLTKQSALVKAIHVLLSLDLSSISGCMSFSWNNMNYLKLNILFTCLYQHINYLLLC